MTYEQDNTIQKIYYKNKRKIDWLCASRTEVDYQATIYNHNDALLWLLNMGMYETLRIFGAEIIK